VVPLPGVSFARSPRIIGDLDSSGRNDLCFQFGFSPGTPQSVRVPGRILFDPIWHS
jgi:hypothetical protein